MPKGPFLPSEFVPTKFSTAADKADFGNAFLHFIESEWKETLFIKTFYNRMSNTFGHIAHFNRPTFYSTWFTSDADRLHFLEQALEWPCWGDPAFTFCDVERALQREIRKRNYVARYELKAAEASRSIKTMATDGISLFYNPDFVDTLNAATLCGVLAYEVLHPGLAASCASLRTQPRSCSTPVFTCRREF
jgi:hypothetical protein